MAELADGCCSVSIRRLGRLLDGRCRGARPLAELADGCGSVSIRRLGRLLDGRCVGDTSLLDRLRQVVDDLGVRECCQRLRGYEQFAVAGAAADDHLLAHHDPAVDPDRHAVR